MKNVVATAFVATLLIGSSVYGAQQWEDAHPGLQPYTPTRIEWLATSLEASLKSEDLRGDGYLMHIVQSGSETLTIFVRFLPTVDREAMNLQIDTARRVIATTSKSYGWDKWVQVREDIQVAKPNH